MSSDRPWTAGSRFAECYRDLLAWRTGLDDALQFTEENVYTRIEMGQLTALFARELSAGLLHSTRRLTTSFGTVHVRYTWALGTLLDTARQRYNPRYAVEAGVWASEIARLSREAWCGISNAVKEILKVVPDFVPGDPMRECCTSYFDGAADSLMYNTIISGRHDNHRDRDAALHQRDARCATVGIRHTCPFGSAGEDGEAFSRDPNPGVFFRRFPCPPRSPLPIGTLQLDYLLRRQSMHLRAVLESSKMDLLLREYAVPDAVPTISSAMASGTNYHTSSSVWMPGFTLDEPVNVGDNSGTSVWDFPLSAHPTPRADLDPPNALAPLALAEENTSTFGYGDYELPMPQYQLDNDDTSSSRAPYRADRASAERWDVAGAAGNVDPAYQLFM